MSTEWLPWQHNPVAAHLHTCGTWVTPATELKLSNKLSVTALARGLDAGEAQDTPNVQN